MIPNHSEFIEAISERKKVRLSYYSPADSSVLDRECAPLDYGPGGGHADQLNRYWLFDYAIHTGGQTTGLLPQQIVVMRVLGENFAPAEIGRPPWPFAVPRDWGSSS